MKKSKWDPRATRYERMREAWKDAMRSGTTKLPFAQFEERMIDRDQKIKKVDFFNRRIRVNWDAIEKELATAK
jgi:hypothetical protein